MLRLGEGEVILERSWERFGIRLQAVRLSYGETVGDFQQVQHNPDVAALRAYLLSLPVTDPHPTDAPWKVPPEDWYRR